MTSPPAEPLLQVLDLTTDFRTDRGTVRVLDKVSLELRRGEVLGLVGESGSGKSITALSVLRLIQPPGRISSGEVLLEGRDLMALSERDMSEVRGRRIGLVLQDAMTSLNPVLTIGQQIVETLKRHRGVSARVARDRAAELLRLVGIPDSRRRLDDYPHQFSGGMRQRAMIAIALSCEPDVLIADEPTTALDVTIQAQIIELLARLKSELSMSLIMITHDLGVIAGLADRVSVMYAGQVVETGAVRSIFKAPQHPYTQGLLDSIPRIDQPTKSELQAIRGFPPDLMRLPKGCTFAPRCDRVMPQCDRERPLMIRTGTDCGAACWLADTRPNAGHSSSECVLRKGSQ